MGIGAEICLYSENSKAAISSPLVRGMAYGTFVCGSLTLVLFTQHSIHAVNGQKIEPSPNPVSLPAAERFEVQLANGQSWLLYSLNGSIQFSVSMRGNQSELVASAQFTGTLRAALQPSTSDATILDKHVNVIPTGCHLTLEEKSYTMRWQTKGGNAEELLHYTLLHHRSALLKASSTGITLRSTTKGPMVAYIGCEWLITVELPAISWLPPKAPDEDKVQSIQAALSQDVDATFTDPEGLAKRFPDNYFAGKELHKFALLILVADSMGDYALRDRCLAKLKSAMVPFLNGTGLNPLRYDLTWGGLVGARGLQGDMHADFGASYYNDHHYHWGYFIQAAAIIGHFDQAWALENRAWVEALIRDVANPSSGDPFFTPFRSFDWFSGHCWSQGLFESNDGKDQESTSEEINFHYGVMLWGIAVGSMQLEQLGRLMTAVSTRSIKTYFLMDGSNEAHPSFFIGNKVTGIYFENKVDYTTWFGSNPEYIHGIQMLPMTPISETVRSARFVAEEWPLLEETAHSIGTGWKSVLWMNYAILDRNKAFQQLCDAPLDGGITRTWALFWCATRPTPASL